MTHNRFARIGSNQPTAQNRFLKLIQIDARSKRFQNFDSNQLTTQKNHNLDSDQLVTQRCYSFPVSHDLFLGIQLYCCLGMTCFGAFHSSVDFVWLFWAFDSSAFPTNWFESAHDSSSISETLESIQLMTQQTFQELTRINPWLKWIPRYWFRWTHDSKCFPIFFHSNQLMTQRKKIFYSESTQDFKDLVALAKS